MRISGFASKPPQAEDHRPGVDRLGARRRSAPSTPVTRPRSSVRSRVALASKRTSMPALAAEAYSMSISPGPPPTASSTRPPQKRNLSAHLVGLAAEHRDPADAAVLHPAHRRAGDSRTSEQRHVGVRAVLGDPHEVVVEIVLGVRIDLHLRGFLVGEVADERPQLVEGLEGEAKAAGGEEAVAAAPRLRRLLQHEHARPRLARRSAAHIAALPPPTTMTSYVVGVATSR